MVFNGHFILDNHYYDLPYKCFKHVQCEFKKHIFYIGTQYNAISLKQLKNKTNAFLYHLIPYGHIIPDDKTHPPYGVRILNPLEIIGQSLTQW